MASMLESIYFSVADRVAIGACCFLGGLLILVFRERWVRAWSTVLPARWPVHSDTLLSGLSLMLFGTGVVALALLG